MKKKFLILASIFSSALFVSACTTTPEECDPSQEANMLNKLGCKLSGSYDKRIENKEMMLLDAQATNKYFRSVYVSIEEQKNNSFKSVEQRRQHLRQLNQSVNTLLSKIKQKNTHQHSLLSQIDAVQRQLKKVNGENTSVVENQMELNRLQKKLNDLEQAIGL